MYLQKGQCHHTVKSICQRETISFKPTLCLYVDSNFIVCSEPNDSGKFESASAK